MTTSTTTTTMTTMMTTDPSRVNGKRFLLSDEVSGRFAETKAVRRESPSQLGHKDEHEDHGDNEVALMSLPDDILCNILSHLDVRSLLGSRYLNRSFRRLASQGSAGWENLCRKLWEKKIHVSKVARDHADPMIAYRLSIEDAQSRNYVHPEELIFDPLTKTGTVWSFRFKESAGIDWTSWDPWYNGRPCRKMVFLADGSVKEYKSENQNEDASLEGSPFSERMDNVLDPPLSMNWRFITYPLDMPARPHGSYIRFSVAGRDVPTYCVRRSPTKNWGFVMESCWGVYASFELPKRFPLPMRTRRVLLRRAQDALGNWFNVEVEASDEEDTSTTETHLSLSSRLLIDDDTFVVTSSIQWREAFMYNVGARELPEGENGLVEFERMYTSIHR